MKNLPGFWKAAFEIFVELSISERVNNSRLSKSQIHNKTMIYYSVTQESLRWY